jgi:hypothetical protein
VPWHYPHRSLGEPDLPDGSAVRRPVVTLAVESIQQTLLAVLDSGSPVSIADASLFAVLGIDLTNDEPLYQLPLTIAGGAGALPVYEVTLGLQPPADTDEPIVWWRLHLGARTNWRLPFAVLLGQSGWFDTFPTTIDATESVVDKQSRIR